VTSCNRVTNEYPVRAHLELCGGCVQRCQQELSLPFYIHNSLCNKIDSSPFDVHDHVHVKNVPVMCGEFSGHPA
jgi:hypothetical protein